MFGFGFILGNIFATITIIFCSLFNSLMKITYKILRVLFNYSFKHSKAILNHDNNIKNDYSREEFEIIKINQSNEANKNNERIRRTSRINEIND
ncbi:MAG: hypothetical protein K0R54_740 [Clostridiaceae bacterium]|jgi:hypothetical protein|nr:hypothetical protein [Clostridiaceae bacterium]